jgi:hypothetical protein
MSMVIDIDRSKWEIPSNRLPQRHHSAEKQTTIRIQVDALLKLGVIEESRAAHWSQVHPVLKSPGKWRLTLDFVKLNATKGGLEGWPIPNIQQTRFQLVTMKPTVFGLLDFTAGYHQTPLDPASRHGPFHGHGGIVPLDPSGHGIERIWPLLSTQYVKHSPSGARVSNLRTVHRRCTDPWSGP